MSSYSPAYNSPSSIFESFLGAIKLVSFIGSALIAALLISSSLHVDLPKFAKPADPQVVATTQVTYTNFPDVGKVYTPHINATLINGTQQVPATFLIDSGAKISALPIAYIAQLNIDTSTAKRIYLRSATNNTTYGYLTKVDLRFQDGHIVTIPVTFAEIIEPLLGTFGFFDTYSVIFDANEDVITIKSKG